MGVIFISHKLGEVLEITSRITIMRHGKVVAERENDGGLSKPELARLMCGRDLVPPAKPAVVPGAPLLVLDGISRRAARVPLSRCLADAEGRRDRRHRRRVRQRPARARRPRRRRARAGTRAQSRYAGEIVAEPSPRRMQALSVGRVPEDRLTTGMIGAMPLAEIMALPWIERPALQPARHARPHRHPPLRRRADRPLRHPHLRARRRAPARSPAAICRRRCSPARSRATRKSCSRRSRRAASTSARRSSSTASSWRCAPAAARCS